MSTEVKCRRCSECVGADHHWLDDFEVEGIDYACKHCPAVGIACLVCDGSGLDPEDETDCTLCEACDGEGVVMTGTDPDWEDS
jgi:hypothetical protein